MPEPTPRKRNSFAEEAIKDCLHVIESGDAEKLFEIIPRIGVLRDARFATPLLRMLRARDVKLREFAAYAIGAMGDRSLLDPLKDAFAKARKLTGRDAQELLIAVIESIGVLGDDTAAEVFLPILRRKATDSQSRKLARWLIESLGAVAQQGGRQSLEALLELTGHSINDVRALAVSEISVAFWHRPNQIPEEVLERLYELTRDRSHAVSESAAAALESLADVGCTRAEELFQPGDRH